MGRRTFPGPLAVRLPCPSSFRYDWPSQEKYLVGLLSPDLATPVSPFLLTLEES